MTDARLKGIHLFTGFDMSGSNLVCNYHDSEIMSIPFKKICNTVIYNGNEIEVDMPVENHNENDDILCEVRFYIPGKNDTMDPHKDKMESNIAEIIHQEIKKKAKIEDNAGDLIVNLPDLPLVVPRGKYTCDLYRESEATKGHMKLHGSTFNYKVLYKNIVKAFLLPQNDDTNMNLVLGFDKPLRQGSTMYPYIIFQFKRNFVQQIELCLRKPDLEVINPDLQETYEGNYYEIVAKLFKLIIGINIIIPGEFKTIGGYSGLKCHVQNQEGILFPLNKSLIFIKRPVIYIRLDDISRVEFARVSAGHGIRGFDFEIILKNGISSMFSGIDKRELDQIMSYFEKNRILTKTNEDLDKANGDDADLSDDNGKRSPGDDEDEEEDGDFIARDNESGFGAEDDEFDR